MFHTVHGSSVALHRDRRRVLRDVPVNMKGRRPWKQTTVFSSQPLHPGETFTVMATQSEQFLPYLAMGVCSVDPATFLKKKNNVPDDVIMVPGSYIIDHAKVYQHSREVYKMPDSKTLAVATGDKVGVTWTRDGQVRYHKNYFDYGQVFGDVFGSVWVVIQLYWLHSLHIVNEDFPIGEPAPAVARGDRPWTAHKPVSLTRQHQQTQSTGAASTTHDYIPECVHSQMSKSQTTQSQDKSHKPYHDGHRQCGLTHNTGPSPGPITSQGPTSSKSERVQPSRPSSAPRCPGGPVRTVQTPKSKGQGGDDNSKSNPTLVTTV